MLREEELADAILLVLANKQDIDGCLSVAEVHQVLGLDALKNRTFQVSISKNISRDFPPENLKSAKTKKFS